MSTEETEIEVNDDGPTAMEELLTESTMDQLGRTISGVLEFLTHRALQEGSFYIMTDNKEAITVFGAGDDAITLKDSLPENIKSWEDQVAEAEFITDRDTGDEQDDDTE